MSEILTSDNIFANISNGYYHFTTAEKRVSEYVLEHKTAVQYMSISELADECGVAEATISRFCRRLKLKGYNAFKLALAKAGAEESNQGRVSTPEMQKEVVGQEDSLIELGRKLCNSHVSALNQGLALLQPERIKQAVDLMCGAERVYFMGQGGSMLISMVAANQFSTVSPRFFAVQDSHIQASTVALLSSKDVVVFFSYSGSTKELMEIMGLARNCGARVILITRFSKSPGAALADVVLQCGSNEGPLQLGSMPAKMAQLFLVDVLFCEFARRDPESAQRSRERIAEALTERHL